MPVTLIPDINKILQQNEIMLFKNKVTNYEKLSNMDCVTFKVFVYNPIYSMKKSLLKHTSSLLKF